LGQFAYKAVDQTGARVSGVVDAADRRSAVAALVGQGRFVTELLDQTQRAPTRDAHRQTPVVERASLGSLLGGGRVSSKDVLAMTTQLSTAVRAGLPLLNCLELLRKQQHKPGMRRLLDHLVKQVNSGASLSEAMAERPDVFSPLYLSMIRVGETGGILEKTSMQLANILSREEKVKTHLKTGATYPVFVLILGLISAVIVVTWVLPGILASVEAGAAALPAPTRILMGISSYLRRLFTSVAGWVALAAAAAGLYAFGRWTRTTGRLQWDRFKLKIPLAGNVLRTIAVGRFARTLGALTEGGVTILEALGVVRDTMGNEALAQEIDEVAEKVKRGASLADPLEESGYFPPLLVQIVSVGEQTGKLDELLLNAAETFDTDADAVINRFMAIFPAVLILVVAAVIAFIILAALLPILTMSVGGGAL
jgi:type II secretory pathway component PulF